MNTGLSWSPLLPPAFALALGAAAILVVGVALFRRAGDMKWRAVLFLLLLVLVLGPVLLKEARQGLPDKLVVLVDESASQKIGARDKTAEDALAALLEKLKATPGIEPVVIRAGGKDGSGGESTNLLSALRDGLPGLPLQQVAGTVLITDGQVHDVDEALGPLEKLAPFHAILTGDRDEFDRKVTIVSAPKYGLLSQDVKISVKVEEFGRVSSAPVPLSVAVGGKHEGTVALVPGETREFTFRLDHPGQNVFEFSAPAEKGELTAANNAAPVIVSGVRDRLRVLLVSGSPHMGERAWRNLLKSDPSIDLVHFTILRSVNSMDAASPQELSLIVFPVEELFQRKLKDFDLVIFDKYRSVSLLTQTYFFNLSEYIRNGGAFLLALGSDEADNSIFETVLAPSFPVAASPGPALQGAYLPALTDVGRKHPATADLQRLAQQKPWGRWWTQAQVRQRRGDVLMTGLDGAPLLVVSKEGEGRVAALMSDNIWLWSRGEGNQGPYSRLLRNLSHWLMKEPELEEDFIKAEARGRTITVARRDITPEEKSVVMTKPSGGQETIALKAREDGWASAGVEADETGIYSFASGDKKAFVAIGSASALEFADVHTTGDRLKPLIDKTGGGIVWYRENKDFTLKTLSPTSRTFGGAGWLGAKRNNAYAVRSVESRDLIPNPLALLVILGALLFAWWRESGAR